MDDFKTYLSTKRMIPSHHVDFYVMWVSQFFKFLNKGPAAKITEQEIEAYLKQLSKKYEDWQVKQAKEAIDIYFFYYSRKSDKTIPSLDQNNAWKVAADEMVRMLRLKHRALATEKTYLGWLRSFYRFSAPIFWRFYECR